MIPDETPGSIRGPTPLPESCLETALPVEFGGGYMGYKDRDAARNFLDKMAKRKQRIRDARVEKALSQDEVKARLALTEEDARILRDVSRGRASRRYVGQQLQALKMRIAATVEPPTQAVSGDIGVRVVVNTMKRELPGVEQPKLGDGDEG